MGYLAQFRRNLSLLKYSSANTLILARSLTASKYGLLHYVHIIVCYFADSFDPELCGDAHNCTKDKLFLKLFAEKGYPEPGNIPLLNRKVFKGTRVSIREHPYILSIRREVSHYCMGTLLTKNIVLTVAHPLINVPVHELRVVAGENYADRGSTLLTVVLLIIHELFNQYTLANDIALIRIYEDLTYRGSIKPIGLVSPNASLTEETAFVTGWGRCDRMGRELCLPRTSRYFPGEKLDPMLRTVSFAITEPNLYCYEYKKNEVRLQPGMLCVGPAREEEPMCPCLAVPGAPLVVGARLAALQSWGFGCGYSRDMPLVYTSMQYFQPWLVHNIPILRNITREHLLTLFLATKAHILTEWLTHTRPLLPEYHSPTDRHVEALSIDKELSKIHGAIYDIRDYLYHGLHHKCKVNLLKRLRKKYIRSQIIGIYATMASRYTSPRPFLQPHEIEYQSSNATIYDFFVMPTDRNIGGDSTILTDLFDHSKSTIEDRDFN